MNTIKQNISSLLLRSTHIQAGEGRALFWSFTYFFSLLCSYYIIRPMRDEMGILGGVENLQWLFTGTLIAMTCVIPLFGWISSNFPRRRFLPYVYICFILMLLVFYAMMSKDGASPYVARAFFIWVSVFNLFIVSVFWSFMADLYNNEQAKRLFGIIAAGGTVGALTGPAITALLVQPLGPHNLLLLSALFLSWAILCINRLSALTESHSIVQQKTPQETEQEAKESPISGSIWSGVTKVCRSPYLLGICILILLYTTLSTFLYLMQAQIIRDAFVDSAQRTAVFAAIDLAVNGSTLVLQLFLTGRLIKWFGLPIILAIVPALLAIGFTLLSLIPSLTVLLAVQIIRRAGNYAVMKPAREMLYVVLSREEKYKAKNVIDTVIYRTGDAVSSWVYAGMRSLGLSLSGVAMIAIPLSLIWAFVSFSLGRQQGKLAGKSNN